jgi:hypothetical protein
MGIHYLTVEQVVDIFKMAKKDSKDLKPGMVFTLAEEEVICLIADKAHSKSTLLEK